MLKTQKELEEIREIVSDLRKILEDTLEVLTPGPAIPAKKPANPDASNQPAPVEDTRRKPFDK